MRSIEARAYPSERAEGDVVRREPLEVAGERPCEAEEADGDDRHRQREDRRLFGRARDQVPAVVMSAMPKPTARAPRAIESVTRPAGNAGERQQAPEGSHQAVSGRRGDPPALEPYDRGRPWRQAPGGGR